MDWEEKKGTQMYSVFKTMNSRFWDSPKKMLYIKKEIGIYK